MKKSIAVILALVMTMVGLPWATVTFASHDAGMAICFLLFFGLDPLCSLCVGMVAGLQMKQRWFLPVVNSALFLLGTWLQFEPGEPAFVRYAAVYLIIGLFAMAGTAFVTRKKTNG